MRHYRGPYLPARPAFLLTARLPYDDLLRSGTGCATQTLSIKACQSGLPGVPLEDVWMCFPKC